VETLNGSETITVEVEPSDTVGDVKAKIQDQQRLIFDDSRRDNKRKLDFYKVQHHSTLHLDDLCSPRDDAMQQIGDFKAKIQDQQRLLFEGQRLVDVDGDGQRQTLANYHVQRQATPYTLTVPCRFL